MKKIFTRLCIAIIGLSMTALLSAQEPEVFWGGPDDPNGSFDGGLNDWTTVGVSATPQDSAHNAIWVWKANGMADMGAYWGTRGPIESESVDNGAMVFNSDFLDNNGIEGNFGAGLAPTPHRGELISPVIDCSAQSSVVVNFTQFYRNFISDNTFSFVLVSNDGGDTWTEFEVNPDVPTNSSTSNPSFIHLNVSDVAANQDSVRIKFAFEGDYYFWIIDDVSLSTITANDLVAEHFRYSVKSFRKPDRVNDCDTLDFAMSISNMGGEDQTNVELTASILDESENMVFSTTESIGTYEAGRSNDTFNFEDIFVMDQLSPGVYTLRYEVSSDSMDFFPDDNVLEENFVVTNNMYSKDINGPSTFFRSATPSEKWNLCPLYQTCDFDASCGRNIIKNVRWAFSANEDDFPDLGGVTAEIYVAKVDDEECPLLPNFDPDDTDLIDGHEHATLVGYNIVELDTLPQGEFITTNILDYQELLEGNVVEGAPIEPNSCYLVGVYTDGLIFLGFEEGLDYPTDDRINYLISTTTWFTGFTGQPDPAVRAETDFCIGTNDVPQLSEAEVSMFPNPVQDQLTLDFELESPQDVKVYVNDIMGRTIQQHELSDIVNDNWTTEIHDVQAGTYFLHVVAEDGERTMKFIKQ